MRCWTKGLSDELDKFNAAATPDVAAAQELTVRIEEDGELVAGASGWTWVRPLASE